MAESSRQQLERRLEADTKVRDALALRMRVTLRADGPVELACLQAAHVRAGSPRSVSVRMAKESPAKIREGRKQQQ